MRLTFQDLYTQCQSNTSATDATSLTYFKQQINTKYQLVLSQLQDYQDIKTATSSTVAAQQYYHNPPGYVNIESVTITIGSVKYILKSVDSSLNWDKLNAVQFTGSAIPVYFFQKRDSFGIWPTPQGVYTLTLNYIYRDRNMSQADYSTGTVSVVNNSTTVTGVDTTWTGAMVGRWFTMTSYPYWYRITAAATTSLTLEEAVQSLTDNTLTYRIGETPELPEESHELLSIGATADFYAGLRKDLPSGTWWNNVFWTGDGNNTDRTGKNVRGGLIGLQKRYASRSSSKIIRHGAAGGLLNTKIWAESIS